MISQGNVNYVNDAKSFVGIKVIDNEIFIFIPTTYRVSDNEKEAKKEIVAFLKTIIKISESNLYIESEDSNSNFPLGDCFLIIEDFLENGLYRVEKKDTNKKVKGKINWKRTIQNNSPILCEKNYIFTDLYYTNKKNVSDFITIAFLRSLEIAINKVGWLFNLSIEAINDSFKTRYSCSNKFLIGEAKKELQKTFNDKKRVRIESVIRILTGEVLGLHETKKNFYGIDYYDIVFEKIVNIMFSNIANKSEYFPRAYWILDGEPNRKAQLKPDTLLKMENNIYIIDAKMYKYGCDKKPKSLPNTKDIEKQIVYANYISCNKQKFDINNIKNCFIIPYNKEKNLFGYNQDLVCFGYSEVDWIKEKHDNFHEKVLGIFIDMKFLINNYAHNQIESRKLLIKVIEEYCKNCDFSVHF